MVNKNQKNNCRLFVVWILLFPYTGSLFAEVYFHPKFLEKDGVPASEVDLSHFQNNLSLPPGKYRVDIYINNEYKFTDEITFTKEDNHTQLVPHFTHAQLKEFGLTSDVIIPPEQKDFIVSELIPESSVNFDDKAMKVNLSMAQVYITQYPRGYIAPSTFDHGINALFLDYKVFGTKTSYKKFPAPSDTFSYINMRSGLNVGAWRVRNYSLYQYNNKDGSSWDNIQTYAQRDIPHIQSQLILGEYYLSSELFDVFSFKGAYLFSDEMMRPDSMIGYAPTVRGIAKSNAMVEVKQGGHVIYQKEVAPGPFEINDLYQSLSAEELEVTITESDGEKRTFNQSATSLPILEREKNYRYNLVAGRFNDSVPENINKPYFGLASIIYGFPHGITGYAGVITSNDYQAYASGLGKSMGVLGVASIDITHANSQLNNNGRNSFSGQQYRFQYMKQFKTDTMFSVSYQSFSNTPYLSFGEATKFSGTLDDIYLNQKKNRLRIGLTQNFSRWGALYLNHDQTTYKEEGRKTKNTDVGYRYSFPNHASISLGYSLQEECCEKTKKSQVSFGLSFPLFPKKSERAGVNYQYTVDNDNQSTHSASLAGSLLEYNQLNYSVQVNRADENTSGSVSAGYLARQMQLDASYSVDSYQDRFSYGLAGAVIAHSGGVTLSQPLTDNVILVDTNGISDIRLINKHTVLTDRFGYAVIPFSNPYRLNEVTINVEDFDPDTEAMISSVRLTPNRGSIVKATYDVQRGRKILATIKQDEKLLPFGAVVRAYNAKDIEVAHGIVDANGQVFISGLSGQETLKVIFKNNFLCSTALNLTKIQPRRNKQSDVLIEKLDLNCRQSGNEKSL